MEKNIDIGSREEMAGLLGAYDKNLRLVRNETGANIVVRNGAFKIRGNPKIVQRAFGIITQLKDILKYKTEITEDDILGVMGRVNHKENAPAAKRSVFRQYDNVQPRSEGQAEYLEGIDKNEITLSIGPAGTGKTFLAVAKAVEYLRAGKVRKIILTRPAVEAGEKLGFLPGDIEAKVNPYLRPIYDALNHFLEFGQLRNFIANDIIEIVPLAFMRGRTLEDAFIILDEAQNTTHAQMKMFLTRMGEHSKIVATGDITQIDLPQGVACGLIEVIKLLANTKGISIIELTMADIVRHPLVQKIVEIYERYEK